MKTLITGATGLVGYNIATDLLAQGREVCAAVRDVERARGVLPEAIELVCADIMDAQSIHMAMEGCGSVFHCAGLPEQWLANPERFEQVNVAGTQNVIDAALAHGVERFVHISTIDVFAADVGAEYDESVLDAHPKGTYYERSKQDADRLVVAGLDNDLPAVFVHPAAVYGPGPAASPGMNNFIADLRDRNLPGLLPGGMPVVFAPDLAKGVLLAEACDPGTRFIFADRYYTLQEIAEVVAEQCPSAKVPRTLPNWVAGILSGCGEALAKVRKKPPLIPKGQLHFLRWQAKPQNHKAVTELGWQVTPLSEGVRETLAFLASSSE